MMHGEDKVHVDFEEIENGFVVHRSWHERKGEKMKYHSQDVFFKDLPDELKALFKNGYVKGDIWGDLKSEKLTDEEEEEGE